MQSFNKFFDKVMNKFLIILYRADHQSHKMVVVPERNLGVNKKNKSKSEFNFSVHTISNRTHEITHQLERVNKKTELIYKEVNIINEKINLAGNHCDYAAESVRNGKQSLECLTGLMKRISSIACHLDNLSDELKERINAIGEKHHSISSRSMQAQFLSSDALVEPVSVNQEMQRSYAFSNGAANSSGQTSHSESQKLLSEVQIITNELIESIKKGVCEVNEGLELASQTNDSFEHIGNSIQLASKEMNNATSSLWSIKSGNGVIVESLDQVNQLIETIVTSNERMVKKANGST
ncbi:methyl-accepting chemotaxis protein [Sporolactobacillus shoreicorticis]|uniref:Methyl-accepting transducer domain-containing protein n=1 Tax=Sporolactobacillus shoreicorticis TaxID=1923877 RepID=A0ABW5S0Y8_9BACL|nr:methyl-accepting chemotaxis protein [Sporolactobacillus shoreicorticis]MCO7127583.1 methyl-accepting chemotaxis protein [Sporolactobacillus shoreicorticis]